MDVNQKFRLALLERWGTQLDASRELGINYPGLSLLVRNRRKPTATQREKLLRHFSAYQLRKFFPSNSVTVKIEGTESVNSE